MIAYLALVIALVGLALYFMSAKPKTAEVGRILFFCGAFVVVQVLGAHAVKLF